MSGAVTLEKRRRRSGSGREKKRGGGGVKMEGYGNEIEQTERRFFFNFIFDKLPKLFKFVRG